MKQRIVGALVLIAVAAVIVPIVFDLRHEGATLERPVSIPPKPDDFTVRVLPLVHPDKQAGEDTAAPPAAQAGGAAETVSTADPSAPAASTVPAVQPPPPPPAAPAPAAPVDDGPKGWAVQVGSFSSEDHAVALRDKLRRKRYTAFIEKVTLDSGQSSYRVQVGPELLRSDAERLQSRLQRDAKLAGIVVGR